MDSSSQAKPFRFKERIRRLVILLKETIMDERTVALACCLAVSVLVKYLVFWWSVNVVEGFKALYGIATHGVIFGVGDHLVLEHFDDWAWYYDVFADRFLQGYLPYTPELYELVPGNQSYIYPPLFLYLLVAFRLIIPGPYSIEAGIVLSDLATESAIFLAALRVTRNTARASLAATLYFANPIVLWWTDFCWFGTSLFTCLMTLSFLCLIEGRLNLASLLLALACMTKQVAAILVPLLLILALNRGWRSLLTTSAIMASVALLLSLPYLLIMPTTYLRYVLGPASPFLYLNMMPPFNSPVQLFASFWFLPAPARNIISYAVYTYIPLTIALLLIYSPFLINPHTKPQKLRHQLVAGGLLLSLAFYTFFPRGIFKWYLVAIIPFLALAAACTPSTWLPHTQPWTEAKGLKRKTLAVLGSKATIASILCFTASCALTWCHRWMGPGILLVCLIGYAAYWIHSSRTASQPNPPTEENLKPNPIPED